LIIQAQDWVRIYGDNIDCYAYSLIETNDKGYFYAGKINHGDNPNYGWIFKTDINGEVLWDKKFGYWGSGTFVQSIKQTIDNGYILSGTTSTIDPYGDPFVMKLNECGEKEWCKILNLPDNMDFGGPILQLSNGNYIALLTYFSYVYRERIWLMCFNEAGDFLWKKVYAQGDPYLTDADGYDLICTSDSSILITGGCFYRDYPDTTAKSMRPLLIKTDFDGNEKWTTVWGVEDPFIGHAAMSIEDKNGNIYTVGRHSEGTGNVGASPTLLKTSPSGDKISYYDLFHNTDLGIATTISWLGDSTLAVGAGWRFPGGEIIEGIAKIDTSGNIQFIKDVIEAENTFQGSIQTFDNKLLIMGGFYFGNNWDIYAFKFNKDLEYDSVYTQPFVYDSLCDHPIISDTISLDCDIVGVEETKAEDSPKLSINPNPAFDRIQVKLPGAVITHSNTSDLNVTTWKYSYKGDVPLEIYDIYGQKWHSEVMPDGVKETEITVRTLPSGLYIVRALIEGQAVSGKFLKM